MAGSARHEVTVSLEEKRKNELRIFEDLLCRENLHSARAGTRWPTQNHGGTLKALTMGEAEKILIAGSSPHSRLVEDSS